MKLTALTARAEAAASAMSTDEALDYLKNLRWNLGHIGAGECVGIDVDERRRPRLAERVRFEWIQAVMRRAGVAPSAKPAAAQ